MKKTIFILILCLCIISLYPTNIFANSQTFSWYCVRNKEHLQPIADANMRFVENYNGYYIDHTMDVINELLMFVGIGLSGLMHFSLAVLVLVVYLMLTINVSINAHLKKEFRLTYAGLGPTEFRIIMVIVNSLFALIRPLREFVWNFTMFSHAFELSALDCIAIGILLILSIIYLTTIIKDTKEYAIMDPLKKNK